MSDVTELERIERSIFINGSRERVWSALTNAEEFGAWFGADLSGQSFKVGQRTRGPMTLDGCEGLFFDAVIRRIEPQDLMAFNWHPNSGEPPPNDTCKEETLVTFTLTDAGAKRVLLKVVEEGFDKLPAQHRRRTFDLHSQGWDFQLKNVARHAGNES